MEQQLKDVKVGSQVIKKILQKDIFTEIKVRIRPYFMSKNIKNEVFYLKKYICYDDFKNKEEQRTKFKFDKVAQMILKFN